MPHLLERSAVTWAVATGVRGVEGVDCFLAQHFGQVFQGSRLTAAEKNLAVHVTHDGVRIVLVDGFQLTSRLQNKAGRDFTAANGRHQLFQIGNLPDVGALVDKAPVSYTHLFTAFPVNSGFSDYYRSSVVMPDFQCHLSSIALKFITLLHYT